VPIEFFVAHRFQKTHQPLGIARQRFQRFCRFRRFPPMADQRQFRADECIGGAVGDAFVLAANLPAQREQPLRERFVDHFLSGGAVKSPELFGGIADEDAEFLDG